MGCCEKQAVETAVFCWASGPITWPQPGPVGTFLWTSSAVPVTFPLGSSPSSFPRPLRCPESRRSRPHYAPLTWLSGARALAGRSGPGDGWLGGGSGSGVRSRLTAYVRRSAASSEPDGTRGIRLSN